MQRSDFKRIAATMSAGPAEAVGIVDVEMKVCTYLIIFIITFLTFINSGYANNKVPIGEKSSISIIL